MKSVLISIHPKWCAKIARGIKTIEVRKTAPKIETPFKCYIYCTKGNPKDPHQRLETHAPNGKIYLDNGKVFGEFVCDRVYRYASDMFRTVPVEGTDISTEDMAELSCLTAKELYEYEHSAEPKENCINLVGVYGWHISDLKIYNEPKLLTAFRNPCKEYQKDDPQCGNCDYYRTMGEYPAECACDGQKPLRRSPQSWCYVEEA